MYPVGVSNPRLQAKGRVGEVALCDDTASVVTRCAFNARPVWATKHRFTVVSGTMMSKKVRRLRTTTVDFKSTPLEPLALQARVVQFTWQSWPNVLARKGSGIKDLAYLVTQQY